MADEGHVLRGLLDLCVDYTARVEVRADSRREVTCDPRTELWVGGDARFPSRVRKS